VYELAHAWLARTRGVRISHNLHAHTNR
jgi:hypothetical protein